MPLFNSNSLFFDFNRDIERSICFNQPASSAIVKHSIYTFFICTFSHFFKTPMNIFYCSKHNILRLTFVDKMGALPDAVFFKNYLCKKIAALLFIVIYTSCQTSWMSTLSKVWRILLPFFYLDWNTFTRRK